ncbi:MAG: tyrosine-type recombinase/integrase [Cyanobacteria bacterium P01_A01_bin.68]
MTKRRLEAKAYRSREHLYLHELEALLETAKNGKGKNAHRDYTLILIMVRHGLRAIEASRLNWEAINLIGGTIYVDRAKGSKPSTHRLQGDEIEALRKLKDSQPENTKEVFGLQPRGVCRATERVAVKANLDISFHTHMLRHTCGYLLINNNHNSRKVQDYLGHKVFKMTERYTAMATNAFDDIDWNNMKG